MFKWILISVIIFGVMGIYFSHASYTPLSKQIDVKTMQAGTLQYIVSTRSVCVGTCRDYSSNSSYGGSSYGGK